MISTPKSTRAGAVACDGMKKKMARQNKAAIVREVPELLAGPGIGPQMRSLSSGAASFLRSN